MFIQAARALLEQTTDATEEPIDSPEFWCKIAISGLLVLAGGVFAGWVAIASTTTEPPVFFGVGVDLTHSPCQADPRAHGPRRTSSPRPRDFV